MNELTKISYFDLKLEAREKRLPEIFGLAKEIARLNRIVTRSIQHNAVITAPSGCGKTALVMAWAEAAKTNPAFFNKKIVMLNSATLQKIGQIPQNLLSYYQDALSTLENCILIIDSFGEMIYQSISALQNWNTLLKPLFLKDGLNVILTMQPEELNWLMENKSHFLSHFETLKLEQQSQEDQLEILKRALTKFAPDVKIEDGVLEQIIKLVSRFPSLGQMPKSAIQIMDEGLAEIKSAGGGELTKNLIEKIVSEKTGIPLSRLTGDERELLKNLPGILNSKIVGQSPALSRMTAVIQRARLGLRNQNRPLASFLVLGPSGVGKTETAKILAENLYGSSKHFLRIDMSEFGESHAAARLLGSPAGYVGFESGGQLTNHFQSNPYSLLLLDEIEKANPKIFDIFLQILDDGRITSAKGETVDLTQSIIMATSNLAVEEILNGAKAGADLHDSDFIKTSIVPKLLANFRMEFLNRFDSILIYKPLTADELADIAMLEIKKIEERVKNHNIKFNVARKSLLAKVQEFADPRFGARPVKRFVEEACENLITEKLLT